jgi:hypothetical protein
MSLFPDTKLVRTTAHRARRPLLVLAAFALLGSTLGCGGGQKTGDDPPVEEGTSSEGSDEGRTVLVTQCREDVRLKEELAGRMRTYGETDGELDWTEIGLQLRGWESSDENPCLVEGVEAEKRREMHDETSQKLYDALQFAALQSARRLEGEGKLDEAVERLRWAYIGGEQRADELRDYTSSLAGARDRRRLEKFKEYGAYGKLDDAEAVDEKVTCVFGTAAIDPTAEIDLVYQSVFEGSVEMHALCRTPAPVGEMADEDAEGQVVLVLSRDDETGRRGQKVAEVEIGSLETWKASRYFTGRLSLPQGIDAQKMRAYYDVRIILRRPRATDRELVHGGLFWHRM